MHLGKVIGTVVSTRKDEKLEGLKMFIVQLIGIDMKSTGAIVVAIDSVGAGAGEIVLIASGSSARQTTMTEGKPVDTVIMAIVDVLEINGTEIYVK